MTRQEILDLHFIEARSRLVELAAFLDRVERGTGPTDFRWAALTKALKALEQTGTDRARQVLISLSDPTIEPVPAASEKGATGAYRPQTIIA
jgi:hypothetical protein